MYYYVTIVHQVVFANNSNLLCIKIIHECHELSYLLVNSPFDIYKYIYRMLQIIVCYIKNIYVYTVSYLFISLFSKKILFGVQ